jgi:D-alanyl-D-alanine carboxypeptidase/D-alanyl-D-alanine-endopeptidase (penicillin-binding protein 4)
LVKVDVVPTIQNSPAKIQLKPFYPMTIINNVISDAKGSNSVSIKRNEDIAPNMFSVDGAVSKSTTVVIPVLNPKINFKLRLEDSITKKKFEYFAPFKNAKLPDKNVYLVDETEHELAEMLPMILKNSNNMVAETVFKTAGSVYSNDRGTIENSLNMLNAYFEKIGLNNEDIKVVDGSGVSKNNIMTSKFMTDFLIYKSSDEDFEDFKNMLPAPGEGTLKNRMLYFKDNLRAKTGTLSDASAIAGYITTRRGKVFAFDIMINDAKTSNSDKKNIEEQILRNIYLNY